MNDEPRAGNDPCARHRLSVSRANVCARTTPASELRSAMPIPASPSSAARATISSGCEAPRRNEKFVIAANSANCGSSRSRAALRARRDKSRNKDRTIVGKNASAKPAESTGGKTARRGGLSGRRGAKSAKRLYASCLRESDPPRSWAVKRKRLIRPVRCRSLRQTLHRVEEQTAETFSLDGDGDLGVGEAAPLAAPVDDRGAGHQTPCGLDVDGARRVSTRVGSSATATASGSCMVKMRLPSVFSMRSK